jgi:hypothetical protein
LKLTCRRRHNVMPPVRARGTMPEARRSGLPLDQCSGPAVVGAETPQTVAMSAFGEAPTCEAAMRRYMAVVLAEATVPRPKHIGIEAGSMMRKGDMKSRLASTLSTGSVMAVSRASLWRRLCGGYRGSPTNWPPATRLPDHGGAISRIYSGCKLLMPLFIKIV